jgi:aspartokinase/homoserine dehydrogenase 1
MQVLKFGGTSVANADAIKNTAAIIKEATNKDRTIVVVSALGGITDKLLSAGRLASSGDIDYTAVISGIRSRHTELVEELFPKKPESTLVTSIFRSCSEIEDICKGIFLLREFSARTRDLLISYGEIMSSAIVAQFLQSTGLRVVWKDSRELIRTNAVFGNATVDFALTNAAVQQYFASNQDTLYVLPGFIATNDAGATTTLGRGGSDYTASIYCAAMDASVLEIWTDVSGMMTADPRIIPNARIIPHISYYEAMELSHFGAKVIFPPTIQPVMKKNIPILIKNTFAPQDSGTLIENDIQSHSGSVSGISSLSNIALLSLEGSGMVGIPGFSKRLFEALAAAGINVILITQSSSEHSICVGVEQATSAHAKEIVDEAFKYEIETGTVDPLIVETDLSIVALVGDKMKRHTGIAGKMFHLLGRNGVNIRAIAQGSSERNISTVIASNDERKSINVLHEAFFETSSRQINLFIVGVGNVGSKLLVQLHQQKEYLQKHLRMQVNVIGIASSRKMLIDNLGINLATWKQDLSDAEDLNLQQFVDICCSKNLQNTVFADITADEGVARVYEKLLTHSISVVACNKIAASSDYRTYNTLKDLSREYNCSFLFETNVGAGLPIIGTVNDLLRTGDRVNRIEAVLSGTLNFVFNQYDGKIPFAQVVRQAQIEGYTEPDPRLDLSGKDVMRKILILARESGYILELDDIANHSFLPEKCMHGNVSDFYTSLEQEEQHFLNLYKDAEKAGKKLKFVATFTNHDVSKGKVHAVVGLQHIEPSNNLYYLYGKDNIVLLYTDRYAVFPLVVKGAGAGAEVTASGVFADIMRTAGN